MSYTVSVFHAESRPGQPVRRFRDVHSIEFHGDLITLGIGEPDPAGRRMIVTYNPSEVEEVWIRHE